MGIDGFLRQLHDIVDTTHLQRFAGQTLVVDALSWLHKACYGCAFELSTGKETDAYVQYMLRKVHMMWSYGVAKVILVFDGQRLPLKSLTHEKRKRYKEENRRRALGAMADSKKMQGTNRSDEVNKAYQLFQRSVSITPQIISTVMNALRAARIPFVVAPFEADAQMVWLCKKGFAAGIVTEDSDVVVYCLTADVSCPVLVKLEDNGAAQAVSRSILHKNSAKATSNALLRKIHFLTSGDKETIRMFVQVCVLAGCDFIDSLPNVGFATAVKHIFNFRGAPAHLRVQRLASKLLSSGTKVPAEFLQEFVKAETIFFHHIVFNPEKRCCELLVHEKHINCFPDILQRAKESLGIASSDEVDLMSSVRRGDLRAVSAASKSFLGEVLSSEIVEQIYKGELCARTLRSLSDSPASSRKQGSFTASQFKNSSSVQREPLGTSVDQPTRKEVPRLSSVAVAQQIENKKRLHANERAVSLHGLMSVYKATNAAAASATNGAVTLTASTQTLNAVHLNGSKPSFSAGPSAQASIMSAALSEVKSSKVTAMSMKDLVAKHSQSIQPAKSPRVQEAPAKVVTQSAPGSRKRPRQGEPVARVAIARTLVHKPPLPNSGRKTLFDFFQKQT